MNITPRIAPAWSAPPRLAISEWADTYRVLSTRQGRWLSHPYQRGMMDAAQEPGIKEVWVQKSAQIGWTEVLLNVCGYYIHLDPSPIMIVQPNQKPMGEDFSKDRLSPMIYDTPVLVDRVAPKKSRDSDNTILHKRFPGGYVAIVGANSPAGLRSRPIRVRLLDEVDSFPVNIGNEGDPLILSAKRQTTFWNRVTFGGSTPTIRGISRIEQMFDACDQRRYCHPCKHCGEMHWLTWQQLDFSNEGTRDAPIHHCPNCGRPMTELEIKNLHARNEAAWIPQQESKVHAAVSMHIWEAYSPWVTWPELVASWLDAKRRGPEAIQAFKNTSLGETYEEQGDSVDPQDLVTRERVEVVVQDDVVQLPSSDICLLTAGLDWHDDRFECEIVGWGIGERSWSIAYEIAHGQPNSERIKRALENLLIRRQYLHPNGQRLPIAAAGFDAGDGEWADVISELCRPHMRKRGGWLPTKGASKFDAPLWVPPSKPKRSERGKIKPYILGVSALKRKVYGRLKIQNPETSGHMTFGQHNDAKYFRGLTGEKLITRYSKGFPVREWYRSGYNEPLDCRVIALAMLYIVDPNLESLTARLSVTKKTATVEKKPAPPQRRQRRSGGGYLNRW